MQSSVMRDVQSSKLDKQNSNYTKGGLNTEAQTHQAKSNQSIYI